MAGCLSEAARLLIPDSAAPQQFGDIEAVTFFWELPRNSAPTG